jgi:DNA-nicking Smr family endonuclease
VENPWEEIVKHTIKLKQRKIAPRKYRFTKLGAAGANNFALSSTLDLHGYSLDQAFHVFINFITNAYKNSIREVLVITGKGSPENPSSIKLELKRWIEYTEICNFILDYKTAPAGKGGEGAVLIKLRKRR